MLCYRLTVTLLLFAASLGLAGCATTLEAQQPSAKEMIGREHPDANLAELSLPELLVRGQGHLDQGHLKLAQLHYARALQVDESSVEAIVGLGQISFNQKNYQGAAAFMSKAIDLEPGNPDALLFLGKSQRAQGEYDLAKQTFAKAQQADPMNPEILTEFAICQDMVNRWDLSEPVFRQVVDLQPSNPMARNNLAFNLLVQGKYPEAIRELRHAMRLRSDLEVARNNLAAAYILNGQPEMGKRLFNGTLGEAAAYNNLGYLYMLQNRWDDAETALNKAMDLNPVFYVRARNNLERLKERRLSQADAQEDTINEALTAPTQNLKE